MNKVSRFGQPNKKGDIMYTQYMGLTRSKKSNGSGYVYRVFQNSRLTKNQIRWELSELYDKITKELDKEIILGEE